MSEPLLRMTDISKQFGATRALSSVCVEVHPGSVLALIGENGAGKSTLMKILSGACPLDAGSMTFLGRPYAPKGPQDARLAGVSMIYQELNLAPDLSVEDNIMLGQEQSRCGFVNHPQQRQLVRETLARLGHPDLPLDVPVRRLSIGQQQVVEIARALVMDAKLIVFDEPTSSLGKEDAGRLFRVIRKLNASGIGVIYISHFLEEIRNVCDSYTIIRDGTSVESGALDKVSDKHMISRMVGRSVDDLFPTVPHNPGDVVLTAVGITGTNSPRDVGLELRRGEILGIAGLVGAGRTELLRCLFALDPVKQGTVSVAGFLPAHTPGQRIRAGLGFVSEDRKSEGLAQACSLADNLTYSRLAPYSRLGCLNLARRRRAVGEWLSRLNIKARSQQQAVQELSGGNQQKLAIARVLHQDADVLLLDEPTRGIDVGTKAEIYRLMGEQAAAGKSIVFVSSYLPELMSVCDRIGVMARGRLKDVRPVSEWTEEAILSVAVSGNSP